MSLYLPVRAKGGSVAVAVCDRCRTKVYLDDLQPDGNSPGLRVCKDCCDTKDPWRLPARKTENITLRYPRPDTSLVAATIWIDVNTMPVTWRNNLNQTVDWIPL